MSDTLTLLHLVLLCRLSTLDLFRWPFATISRAPYGEYQYSLSAIGARNQSHISWNFDSGDSLGLTVDEIKARYTTLMNANTNNVIALNHSVQNVTVSTIMPWLLPLLKAKGYSFVTMSQCLGLPAYQFKGTAQTRDATWTC